ncbi:MAG: phosphoglucosamine mutase [Bacteroidia bacterium]|nr:phosphoglucosamine mutase [Bacteroidia bacterium]
MALLASISGIRGTVGGAPGDNLTPVEVVGFAAAYGTWLIAQGGPRRVVLGRDARVSGPVVEGLVAQTLVALGFEVLQLGLSTTPTVEMAVTEAGAGGGIVLTASHNPAEWNALKLLNAAGEFLSAAEGAEILDLYRRQAFSFAPYTGLGRVTPAPHYLDRHIEAILAHPLVDGPAIAARGFRVAVDGINSSGAIAIPRLLSALGVTEVAVVNAEPHGQFAHNPEPLPEHLSEICSLVADRSLDLGIVVDPDVDRLAFVMDGGAFMGEEYTLVTAADYVLQHRPGPVVSNLSSSRALADLAARYGQPYYAAAVGEVNVVAKMKAVGATLGGEGNGGVIDPSLHYGRDALQGVALVLSYLATSGKTLSQLRAGYPQYAMAKEKATLTDPTALDAVLDAAAAHYHTAEVDRTDGVKVNFATSWLHLRKSNTEPIVRIYTEAPTPQAAQTLAAEGKALLAQLAQTLTSRA